MDLHLKLSEGQQSDLNGVDLANELIHLRQILPVEYKAPKEVLQYILDTDTKEIFSNVWIALRILLTIPVTVASGERSFSKLKLIKTYVRSTMSDERLSSLAILSIENDIAENLDWTTLVNEFAEIKARKVPLQI